MSWFKNPATGLMTAKAKLGIGLGLLIAIAIALGAAYWVGLGKGKNISALEISRYERDIGILEGKLAVNQAKVDTRIVKEYITDVVEQDRIVYRNRDVIKTLPLTQTLSQGFVYTHNRLAGAEPIDFNLASVTRASTVKEPQALDTIAHNYNVGQKAIIQLEALQKWVRETVDTSKEVADEAARNRSDN